MIQLGDIVLYQLTDTDAEGINRRYVHAFHNMDFMKIRKEGYQAHVGNRVVVGEVVPVIVTKILASTLVNGQALLDGNDSLWVTSVSEGKGPGYWSKRI